MIKVERQRTCAAPLCQRCEKDILGAGPRGRCEEECALVITTQAAPAAYHSDNTYLTNRYSQSHPAYPRQEQGATQANASARAVSLKQSKQLRKGLRGSSVANSVSSIRGPGFNSQNPCVIPLLWDLTSSFSLHRHCTHMICIYAGKP